ncbi:MAG: hypothetical protein GYA20_10190 [Chloroflexi bacterium]|nr:hypothetical protein [Chloroflexota bacterium]
MKSTPPSTVSLLTGHGKSQVKRYPLPASPCPYQAFQAGEEMQGRGGKDEIDAAVNLL